MIRSTRGKRPNSAAGAMLQLSLLCLVVVGLTSCSANLPEHAAWEQAEGDGAISVDGGQVEYTAIPENDLADLEMWDFCRGLGPAPISSGVGTIREGVNGDLGVVPEGGRNTIFVIAPGGPFWDRWGKVLLYVCGPDVAPLVFERRD